MNILDPTSKLLVYMDTTDYTEGLGQSWNGVEVYPTAKSVIANSKCAKTCGIVELVVQFSQVIDPGTAEYLLSIDIKDVEAKNQAYWDWQRAILTGWKAHRETLKTRIRDLDKLITAKETELKNG